LKNIKRRNTLLFQQNITADANRLLSTNNRHVDNYTHEKLPLLNQFSLFQKILPTFSLTVRICGSLCKDMPFIFDLSQNGMRALICIVRAVY